MKYILAKDTDQQHYVKDFNASDYYFSFTYDKNLARRFDSIAEVIQVLTTRSAKHPGYSTDYTIKGLKEVAVTSITYEEVEL